MNNEALDLTAMRARAGITVEPHSPTQDGGFRFHGVKHNGEWHVGYLTEPEAEQEADALLCELADSDAIGSAV